MTTWTITQNIQASGAFEIFEHNGVPVIVQGMGRYPTATSDDGRSLEKVRHVQILIGGATINGVTHYNRALVQAFGERGSAGGGRTMVLDVIETPKQETTDWQTHAEEAKKHLDAAVETARGIDGVYADAYTRIAQTRAFGESLTRTQYEEACAKIGAKCLSDAECDSYGVRYGNFQFPDNTADHVVDMTLAFFRLRAIDADREAARAAAPRVEQPVRSNRRCGKCGQRESDGAMFTTCPPYCDDCT